MDLALNADGDIDVINGDFYFVTGVDATVQFLNQRLRLFLAEWFLDETLGVPYFDEIFVKNPNAVAIDSILKTYIINSPGVLELLAFDMSIDTATRTLTVSGRIRALDGEADFSVSNVLAA